MFNFSTDSLNDYVFSVPTTPTPIVLEKVKDDYSSFDFVIPTIPTKKQLYSIQHDSFIEENEYDAAAQEPFIEENEYDTNNEHFQENPSEFDLPAIQYSEYKRKDPKMEPPKLPFVTNIYVASLTIVGLFLLFRLIQK
jgi:hypothetical protein